MLNCNRWSPPFLPAFPLASWHVTFPSCRLTGWMTCIGKGCASEYVCSMPPLATSPCLTGHNLLCCGSPALHVLRGILGEPESHPHPPHRVSAIYNSEPLCPLLSAGLPPQTVKLELVANGFHGRTVLQSKVAKLAIGTEVILQGVLTKSPQGSRTCRSEQPLAWKENTFPKDVEVTPAPLADFVGLEGKSSRTCMIDISTRVLQVCRVAMLTRIQPCSQHMGDRKRLSRAFLPGQGLEHGRSSSSYPASIPGKVTIFPPKCVNAEKEGTDAHAAFSVSRQIVAESCHS